MVVGLKIFLIGILIFIFGRVLAQFNADNPSNKLWIGAINFVGLIVTFVGGLLWIAMS